MFNCIASVVNVSYMLLDLRKSYIHPWTEHQNWIQISASSVLNDHAII